MTSGVSGHPIAFLAEAAWEKISDSPFNPPHAFDDAFVAEYWRIHAAVSDVVHAFCAENGVSIPGDVFTMNDDYGQSRWISVEAHDPLLLCGRLIHQIKALLKTLPIRYIVALDHDIIDEPFHSIWDIFITGEQVQAFVKSEEAKSYLTDAEQAGGHQPPTRPEST